jgi:PHD/YefM family antitoxin component YafN of YafNO toxin-antitoxin module
MESKMLAIKKEYIVTSSNKKKAVLVDIDTFNKMEELLENYGLVKYMDDVKDEENMPLQEAKKYYAAISKD